MNKPTKMAMQGAGGLVVYFGKRGDVQGSFNPSEMAQVIDQHMGLPELLDNVESLIAMLRDVQTYMGDLGPKNLQKLMEVERLVKDNKP